MTAGSEPAPGTRMPDPGLTPSARTRRDRSLGLLFGVTVAILAFALAVFVWMYLVAVPQI